MDDLDNQYDQVSVEGLLVCAGNRRYEMEEQAHKQVEGLKWDHGALANAKWTGARLNQVLARWGLAPLTETNRAEYSKLHVHFECDQKCEDDSFYGASVPLDKAMDPELPILLAHSMNDEPLTPEHGAPVRLYIPTVIGARSVKWLQRIILRNEESNCFYQKRDYKVLPPEATTETKEHYMKVTDAMLEFDMNAAICVPRSGETILLNDKDSVEVTGYAFGKAVRELAQQLRTDEWVEARLQHEDRLGTTDAITKKTFTWTLWYAQIKIPAQASFVALVAFCEDINGQRQTVETPYNLRGLGEGSWSVVKLHVER
ncbi:hypothetical protein OIO90_000898 [Microbotryomycetes sp. JL221]|nr:hypothetical protein OIO90_000898 [Microbotryomycetes sp. JL221]